MAWTGAVVVLALGLAAYGQNGIERGGRSGANPAADSGEGGAGHRTERSRQGPTTRPEGLVVVDESVVYLMANEPQQHLASAALKLAEKNYKGTAAELRIASDYLKFQSSEQGSMRQGQAHNEPRTELQSQREEGQGKHQARAESQNGSQKHAEKGQGQAEHQFTLKQEAQRLVKLADKIEKQQGGVDEQALHKEFGRVNFALAEHDQKQAEQALKRKEYTRAGYKLDAAALAFEQAEAWSGQQPKQEMVDVLYNAHQVASNLVGENMSLANQAAIGQGEKLYGNRQANARQGQQGEAQTAGARSQAENTNPLLGTTKAEANNIAEHAKGIVDQLGKELDQSRGRFEQGSGGQAQPTAAESGRNGGEKQHENK